MRVAFVYKLSRLAFPTRLLHSDSLLSMSFLCEAAWKKRKTSEGATSSSKAIDGVHLNDTDKENKVLQFTLDVFGLKTLLRLRLL